MLNNTGQMLSIAIVFPLALSNIPFGAIQQVFINGGGMGHFASVIPLFLSGLHLAFVVSFVLSIIAAIVAALRPSHGQRAEATV
jgi:ABC-type lipoprotein release transport system permease subunit